MIVKGALDTSEYQYRVLKNGIRVLLVCNKIFTKSSCSLSVAVGSYDEPDEFLGLAHFLEHMLFMGTEKYKSENEFCSFLSHNNGESNAYTCSELTNYYFDIDSEVFYDGADRFAQFFISPLFYKSSVDREMSAVNSEFLNTLNSSWWREYMLKGELMQDGLVEKRFSCGNEESLRKDGVWEAMIDFWKKRYSSSLMTLVVCGNGSMEELEKISNLFNAIENKDIQMKEIERTGDIENITDRFYKSEFLCNAIHFTPLERTRELQISVIISPVQPYFRTNPIEYISELISSPEEGGLVARLKDLELGTEVSVVSHDNNRRFTKVQISVSLTLKGFKAYKQVISMVHEFLSSLKADEKEYRRLGRLNATKFAYKAMETPIEITETLSAKMLVFPVENVLNHAYVFEDFNERVINDCIQSLADISKWVIMVSDPDAKDEFKMVERYHGTKYDALGSCIDCAEHSARPPKCDKAEDEFLDTIVLLQEGPRHLKSKKYANGELNVVFDAKLETPKTTLSVLFSSEAIKKDNEIYLIYFETIADMFTQKNRRKMDNALVSVSVEADPRGIMITFNGISQRIISIAKLFFQSIPEYTSSSNGMDTLAVTDTRFEIRRQAMQDNYEQIVMKSPFRRIAEMFFRQASGRKTSEEILDRVKSLKKSQVTFKRDFYCTVIATGNIQFDSVEELFKTIQDEYLKGATAGPAQLKMADLKQVEFPTHDEKNNGIGLFYQITDQLGKVEFADHEEEAEPEPSKSEYHQHLAIGSLINEIAHERFFDELRTKEEFGYVVYSAVIPFQSYYFQAFIVQSVKPVPEIEERILKFVKDLRERIKSMSEDEFGEYKQSLIGHYQEPIVNLKELNSLVLDLHKQGAIDLNYNKKMAGLVKELKREDLLGSPILEKYTRVNSIRSE